MIRAIVEEARPKQWAKNVLVFAAPAAAHVIHHGDEVTRSLLLFLAFCLVSSGTYYWNDLLDVEVDRLHPTKRLRPIARRAIPTAAARFIGTALIVVGLGLATAVRWQAGAVVAGYVLLTLSYSVVWKHVAVIDLVAVAGGFVLRAIAGAVAADVPMSTWFLLCTSFASLFIVTGKRYAELRELGEDAALSRATLEAYSLTFLRSVLNISVGAALVTYCIWAFDTTQSTHSPYPFYELSIVPMLCALLRYTLVIEQGHGAAPEDIFAADRTLQVLGVLWVMVFGLGVYLR
ncbi:MAG: decaprenyl-phosphate phosphoribosyltransferase [Ilumatobacteraceae bacterium]|jgi:decaprenyl-phosphate phosphoribosyltransferase|nr:decaprenyl-phosphate phosphoribosyltransferase [Ilumatobacteraceae bacterium]